MTEPARPSRVLLVAAFATVYLIWGSTYLGIALAIQSIPPLLMAGARFVLAGSVLYLWTRVRGAPRPTAIQWGWAALLGGLFFLISNGTVVWVEQTVPTGLVALLVAMVSAWTALLEWLRPKGRRPSVPVMLGIGLGFLGVALLVLPGHGVQGKHLDVVGVLLLMGSTLAWAAGSVYSRDASLPSNTAQAAGMEMLAGGAALLLGALLNGEWGRFDPALVTLKSGLAFLYLAAIGSVVTFTAYAWLLRVSTPAKIATAGYVNPMVAVFLGWAFMGESLSRRTLLASAIIVVGVVVIVTGSEVARGVRDRMSGARTRGGTMINPRIAASPKD